MVAISLLLASFVASASARAANKRAPFAIHESRQAVPSSFKADGAAATTDTLRLRIGLAQKNITGLETVLYDVSTPSSPLYGQHLSTEQLVDYMAPTTETVDAVSSWLTANGLTSTSISPAGDWISVTLTVGQANKLLNTKFETYTHTASGKKINRVLSYSLPSDLFKHIDVVHPTTSFNKPVVSGPIMSTPLPATGLESRQVPSSCSRTITPACLQALYGIPTTKATQSSNKLAVSGFIEQFAQSADLSTFLRALRTDISSSTTFALQTLDGGSNPQGASRAGIEANLDIEYTVGVATGVPVTFISVGENFQDGTLEGFLDIVNFLSGESGRPQVLTTSYGEDESDQSSSMAQRLCTAYMGIGAQGVSIIFASGDGGVSGSQSQSCSTFIPTFPSGCPFMTSVGATQSVPETSASFSSGGFSNVFAQPSYQSSVVSTYLTALGSTNSGKFTRTGRAFPDVSAMGNNVEIVSGGQTGLVGGTSASSPIFASIISLINDRLIAAGKPVLGFLNPFLYANPSAFNDITTGSNPGCNTNGFPARAGWDPVTGLGTPNFAKLLTAAGL